MTKSTPAPLLRRAPVPLATLGLAASLWLAWVHFRAYSAPDANSLCSVSERFDCVSVALSRWAVFLELPVAAWGVGGFLALLIASVRRSAWLLPLAAVAAAGSAALLAIEVVSIGSYCLGCLVVQLVSFALLACSWVLRRELTGKLLSRQEAQWVLSAPAGIVFAMLLFYPRYWRVPTWAAAPTLPHGITDDGALWLGAASPKVTIEEYVHYRCPHCAIGSTRTLQKLAADPSRLRVIRRHLPLTECKFPVSCQELRLSLCAQAQGKGWEADRWLFAHSQDRGDIPVEKFAAGLELPVEPLAACFHDQKTLEQAEALRKAARAKKLLNTPAYIVNGKVVKPGDLDAAVTAALRN